jgi:hypothetical protein
MDKHQVLEDMTNLLSTPVCKSFFRGKNASETIGSLIIQVQIMSILSIDMLVNESIYGSYKGFVENNYKFDSNQEYMKQILVIFATLVDFSDRRPIG